MMTRRRDRRDHQLNIRFTRDEIAALERIAEHEDRDRSYVVAFFSRWGIEQYERLGSLAMLRSTKTVTSTHLDDQARERLRLRGEAQDSEENMEHDTAKRKAKG